MSIASETPIPKIPIFIAGVPGVKPVLDAELSKKILKTASDMKLEKAGKFPGSVSVPLSKVNMKLLSEEDYVVSIKMDGTRYLMIIIDEDVFFINRNAQVFETSGNISRYLNFSGSECSNGNHTKLPNGHRGTSLLDGEMILTSSNKSPTFIVFDVLCLNSKVMTEWNFEDRMKYVKMLTYKLEEPFVIQKTDFYPLSETDGLLKKEVPFLTDGLVFAAKKRAYNCWPTVPGVNDYVMKWKPADLNTVDFLLKLEMQDNKKLGQLYVADKEDAFATIDVSPELEKLDGQIIECRKQDNMWVFYRDRSDKNMPNTIATTLDTLKSIDDAISEDKLMEFIRTSGYGCTNNIKN